MNARVVCISRTLAAGGEHVGKAVSERLGFRYVDEEIVAKAAAKANVDQEVIAAAEHKQPLVRRILDAIGLPKHLPDPMTYLIGRPVEEYYVHLTPRPTEAVPEGRRALIRAVIAEIAAEGNVVIVAHAASFALAGMKGLLRVLVTASPETRIRRLSGLGRLLTDSDTVTTVRESDAERRDYLHRFYQVHEELPTHYDLVVNTDVLPPAQAVNLIVTAARDDAASDTHETRTPAS
jgi:hypothetical protein